MIYMKICGLQIMQWKPKILQQFQHVCWASYNGAWFFLIFFSKITNKQKYFKKIPMVSIHITTLTFKKSPLLFTRSEKVYFGTFEWKLFLLLIRNLKYHKNTHFIFRINCRERGIIFNDMDSTKNVKMILHKIFVIWIHFFFCERMRLCKLE